MMDKIKLGAQLRKLREDKAVTQYRLIKNAGLTYLQVKAIENGASSYTVDSLLAYINALGVELKIN